MGNGKTRNNNDNSNLMKALSEREGHIVHLTHNDLDAVGCDSIHRLHYGEDIFTIWSSVGRFPSLFTAVSGAQGKGDTLSISDLGYFEGVEKRIKKARSNGWKIEWRDHHRWTEAEIAKVKKYTELLHIDTETCATGIVAKDLIPDSEQAKEIARVVCDYDLWKHNDPRSKVLGQVCNRKKNRNYVRDRLVEGIFTDQEIEKEYAEITKERETAIEKSIRHCRLSEGKYRIAFAPLYGYPSETAHAIRDRMETDIEVIISDTGRFSIRSVPPISHLIAREFNGGGHPPAAGGSFKFTLIDKIAFFLLKRNRHFKKLTEVANSK